MFSFNFFRYGSFFASVFEPDISEGIDPDPINRYDKQFIKLLDYYKRKPQKLSDISSADLYTKCSTVLSLFEGKIIWQHHAPPFYKLCRSKHGVEFLIYLFDKRPDLIDELSDSYLRTDNAHDKWTRYIIPNPLSILQQHEDGPRLISYIKNRRHELKVVLEKEPESESLIELPQRQPEIATQLGGPVVSFLRSSLPQSNDEAAAAGAEQTPRIN